MGDQFGKCKNLASELISDGNVSAAITLTGSDVETSSANLTYTVTFGPSHGLLSDIGANRTYTPALNYSGPDSFKFDSAANTGPKSSIDVLVNRNQGGNPFKPFGTWSITF